jgi:hypothetical protein
MTMSCRIHHIYIDLASVTEADSSDPVIPTDSISLFLLVSALYPTSHTCELEFTRCLGGIQGS